MYVYLKSLQQPKYRYFENLFTSINGISYFTFSKQHRCHSIERSAQILFLSLMTWHATRRMRWENTFRWAATWTLTASISVRRTREYLNIWYATTRICWSCSNRIVPTWNTFTTIMWIPTCRYSSMNFVCIATVAQTKYGFLVIDKDSALKDGRYRKGFNKFAIL